MLKRLAMFARSYGRASLLLFVGSTTAYLTLWDRRPLRSLAVCEATAADEASPWEIMTVPDRGMVSTHIIYGTLLEQNNLIERYDVYRSSSSDNAVRGVVKLGGNLDGHPGVVHGGILALLVDDVLGFGFYAMGISMAMTANLNMNYVAPVPANTEIIIDASLERQEGRKLFWTVIVSDANDPDHVYCNATSLYIIPRHAYDEQQSN